MIDFIVSYCKHVRDWYKFKNAKPGSKVTDQLPRPSFVGHKAEFSLPLRSPWTWYKEYQERQLWLKTAYTAAHENKIPINVEIKVFTNINKGC